MKTLLDFLLRKRKTTNGLKLRKTGENEWTVKKGYAALYIGTREKCEYFMNHAYSS